MSTLETERLLLRPPAPEDAAFFTEALNDFEVAKHLSSPPHPYTAADAEAFIGTATRLRAMGEGWVYTIVSKATAAPVGCCGLDLHDGGYEIGYWLAQPYWRRGFATEAAYRLLSFAFDVVRADRIEAGWFHDNIPSGRVLGKLGFEASHVASWPCRARGEPVLCNRVLLTRAHFGRKKAA